MPQPFDSTAVRAWAALARDALGEGRAELDSINVFPVADGDTGTNLHRTAVAAAEGPEGPGEPGGPAAPVLRALARGALLGACGNSGTILAQLLRGMAEVYGEAARGQSAQVGGVAGTPDSADAVDTAPDTAVVGGGRLLAAALRRAAESAYEAVARPVEGTMLTVARAAAEAAERAAGAGAADDAADSGGLAAGSADPAPAAVARAAHEGARTALAATTEQLDALRRAGVVDAGGSGLVAVLGALADALSDPAARSPSRSALLPGDARHTPGPATASASEGDPAYEVMYLLDADDAAVSALRDQLDGLGDSLVVGGGDGLWSVHVHVDDAGAAVEAGIAAGRPHRIRVTHLTAVPAAAHDACSPEGPAGGSPGTADDAPRSVTGEFGDRTEAGPRPGAYGQRAVVAVVHGDGLAGLCEEAGAVVVRAGEALDGDGLSAAVRATGAAEVVLLPNDAELHASAARTAREARESPAGIRVAVVPTRAAVQGVAALAVHDPDRRFDEDVVAMTSAAGTTRYGEVTVAEHRSWTMAGVCESGDVLGLVEGDVAVIGSEVAATAADVLERMLAAGGELVTLVVGEQAPEGLAARLEERVRGGHLGVDTVVYEGGQQCAPLLIGVE